MSEMMCGTPVFERDPFLDEARAGKRQPWSLMVGQRFGLLTVLSVAGTRAYTRCDCGELREVRASSLRNKQNGVTRCEFCAKKYNSERNTSHGLSHTPEYRSWKSMRMRCENKSHKSFERYGGRGIFICEQWRNDVVAFVRDMGLRPSPQHTLERINNDGNYEPGNCRWATLLEQAQNRSNVNTIDLNNERLSVSEWARRNGIMPGTAAKRLRDGWSVDHAISMPPLQGHHRRFPPCAK